MNKLKLEQTILKYDAEYASQVMDTIPVGYIDKTLCGIGITSLAIENDENMIILVPSINLVSNKITQYPNKRCTHTIFGVDGSTIKSNIEGYIYQMKLKNQPFKIISTYDSLHKVEYLLDTPNTKLIVDESNMLLSLVDLKTSDMREGNDVITKLFDITEKYKDITSFLSATPIPVQYMPEFISTMPQIKMTWNDTIKTAPILMRRGNVIKGLKEEILLPLEQNGEVNIGGSTVKKVVVFINSVTSIANIIEECDLNPKDVRVVVGDTLINRSKLQGVKMLDFEENNKTGNLTKYTFITSSGFDGIDLYDKEAMPIVVSNTSRSFTMIDLSTSLKQAISRIRDKDNVHYGKFIFLYNQTLFDSTEEELLLEMESLRKGLIDGAKLMNQGLDEENIYVEEFIKNKDFNAYTKRNKLGYFEINEFRFNADKYYLLETRIQYLEGFDVSGVVGGRNFKPVEVETVTFKDLVEHFNANHTKGVVDWENFVGKVDWINMIKNTYSVVGSVSVNYANNKKNIENTLKPDLGLIRKVGSSFKVGNTYTRKEVVEYFTKLNKGMGIITKGKHTDLEQFFECGDTAMSGVRMKYIIRSKFN